MKSQLLVTFSLALITRAQEGGSPYYRPVSVGVNLGTPFDLTNTIEHVLAGPLVIILTSIFGLVLVAGLVAPHIGHFVNDSGRANQQTLRWYELMHQLDMAQSFHYVGDTRDICRRKIICHVHNVLSSAPFWLQTIYRIISVNIGGVSPFKEDIVFGLGGGDCQRRYIDCGDSLWQLLVRSDPVRYLLKLRRDQEQAHVQT